MKIKSILIMLVLVVSSTTVNADSHTEVAIRHIEVTDLKSTFELTKNQALQRLDAYKEQLLASPEISNNPKAVNIVERYIHNSKITVEDVFSWKNAESQLVSALKDTYTEQELFEINNWFDSKYGRVFIKNQKKFLLKNININNKKAQLLQNRLALIDKKFSEDILNLSR